VYLFQRAYFFISFQIFIKMEKCIIWLKDMLYNAWENVDKDQSDVV
jgi:hypothetical protein